MNFRQLEALVSVVRNNSFSKAAGDLYLTQPTISAHINALEEELGVQLIIRGRKPVTLTDAGTVFYEYANGLLRMRSRALESVKNYPELLSSTLDIAASTVPAEYVLPEAISKFRKRYPNINFVVRESNSETVISRVLAYEVELGFTGIELHKDTCSFDEIYSDRLVIIAPSTDEFACLSDFPTDLLRTTPFVLRSPGSATQKEADSFLISMGISPQSINVAAYMESIEAIKQSVKHGLGIAIVSDVTVKDMEERKEILVFRKESAFSNRKLYCAYRKDKPLSTSAELFLSFLKGGMEIK